MENKITTIRLKESTKKELKKCKKYPRETDEETLIRIIKNNLNKEEVDKK